MSVAGVSSAGWPKVKPKDKSLPAKVRRHRQDFLKLASEVDEALADIQHKLNLLATHTMLPPETAVTLDDE